MNVVPRMRNRLILCSDGTVTMIKQKGKKLIKIPYDSRIIYNGIVCGANIKLLTPKKDEKKDKWGIFIHVRLSTGDQVDFIYKHIETIITGDNILNQRMYTSEYNDLSVPCILAILGVKEWVDIIGTKVEVAFVIKDGFTISASIRNKVLMNWYCSDYIEIYKDKFEPSDIE